MFTVAVKGTYPKFTSPPRPSLLARALKSWRTWQITDGELERSLQRAEVEVVAEMVAAGCEVVWDGQLRWDGPAFLLGSLKGVKPSLNRMIGEKLPMVVEGESLNGMSLDGDTSAGNGHHPHGLMQEKIEVIDRIGWQKPILSNTFRFLSDRVPVDLRPVFTGPISLAQLCDNGYYEDDNYQRIIDIAKALNREIEGLVAVGGKHFLIEEPLLLKGDFEVSQLEEITGILTNGISQPIFLSASNEMTTDPELLQALSFGGYCIDSYKLDPASLQTWLTICEEKESIIELGVVNGRKSRIEDPAEICQTLVAWGRAYSPDRLWASTTTGLGGLTREVAFLKLQALAKGAELARRELAKDE